jgi:hypothetical protein
MIYDQQPRQVVKINRRFGNHLCPHHQGFDVAEYPECFGQVHTEDVQGIVSHQILTMATEMVPETSVPFDYLTLLMVREDFIES